MPTPLAAIRSRLDSLTGTSLILARWFLQGQAQELAPSLFTTGEIARRTGVSRSSVVRFCQELGYDGFAEFRAAWIGQVTAQRETTPAAVAAKFPRAAAKVVEMTVPSIAETLEAVDPAAFERAVEALCNATMTIWYGLEGDSAYLAMSGAHKMIRSALRAGAAASETDLSHRVNLVEKGDVVVVISQSGRVETIAHILHEVKARQITIVGITSKIASQLAGLTDILLLTAARDVILGKLPLGLRAAQLLLVDMLVLEVAARKGTVPLHFEADIY